MHLIRGPVVGEIVMECQSIRMRLSPCILMSATLNMSMNLPDSINYFPTVARLKRAFTRQQKQTAASFIYFLTQIRSVLLNRIRSTSATTTVVYPTAKLELLLADLIPRGDLGE